MKCASLVVLCLPLLAVSIADGATPSPAPATVTSVNEIAEAYVKLVLAMGQHDADYVDAYYGPPEWRKEAEASTPSLAAIDARAGELIAQLGRSDLRLPADDDAPMTALRQQYLARQLESLRSRVAML